MQCAAADLAVALTHPQGCGDKGAADLLLRLAELVVAVKEQQAGGGGGGSSGAAASQALLDAACDAGPRLWSDALQLFPRDMAPLLEEYADVADQVPATLQELRQRLAQEAGGGEAEAPSAAAWARDSAALSAAVAEAMDAGTQLRGVFQQVGVVQACGRRDVLASCAHGTVTGSVRTVPGQPLAWRRPLLHLGDGAPPPCSPVTARS